METGASPDLAAEQTATDRARPHAGGSVARASLCFNDWPLEPFLTPRDFHPPPAGIAIHHAKFVPLSFADVGGFRLIMISRIVMGTSDRPFSP